MNWQKAIDKINIEKYRVPAGWDTKEKIAIELQCAPERVHDLLRGGLASGVFEAQEFPVWDAKRRMTIRVKCYRQRQESDGPLAKPQNNDLESKIKKAIKRHPRYTDYQIAKNVRGSNTLMVKQVRTKL